jgi:hypothetical protein
MRIVIQCWFWQKYETLFEKQTKSKRAGGVAQEVECLPSKFKALKSIPSTIKTFFKRAVKMKKEKMNKPQNAKECF